MVPDEKVRDVITLLAHHTGAGRLCWEPGDLDGTPVVLTRLRSGTVRLCPGKAYFTDASNGVPDLYKPTGVDAEELAALYRLADAAALKSPELIDHFLAELESMRQ